MPEQHNIEKYDFECFEKEQKPYSMILNSVIQALAPAHPVPYAIWSYLESLPRGWTVNKQHIMKTFNISERTYHTHMKLLVNCNLVQYIRYRNADGTLGVVTIRVLNGTEFNLTETDTHTAKMCIVDADHTATKPQCGEPTMVANCGHINTTTNINKKNNINGASSDARVIFEQKGRGDTFEKFWAIYPIKKNKTKAQDIFDALHCERDIDKILTNIKTLQRKCGKWRAGYAPYPDTYLQNRVWEEDINEVASRVPSQQYAATSEPSRPQPKEWSEVKRQRDSDEANRYQEELLRRYIQATRYANPTLLASMFKDEPELKMAEELHNAWLVLQPSQEKKSPSQRSGAPVSIQGLLSCH